MSALQTFSFLRCHSGSKSTDCNLELMNKAVGEEIGALFGGAIEIDCDENGKARGKCIGIRAILDVHKPLVR